SDTNDMLLEILNKAIKTISKDESRLIRKRWSGGGYIIPEKSELPIFNEEEKNWIKRNGKINVVFNEYMAPLSYLNSSGRPAGYAIEILELLRLYSGLDIDYTSSKDFNEQQELVLKSKTPYITILTPNKNRAIFFDFSSEFSSSPYIIVQRKNNVEINDPIIAIPRDHAIEEYTRQYI
ncbi:transporter substrate-binding domain-containing protein, partial [Escherichia coli]|nr:transporter substrate-binding domain-containing protein [Escherichia coli]